MIISNILENICSVESIQFAHIFNKQNDFMVAIYCLHKMLWIFNSKTYFRH